MVAQAHFNCPISDSKSTQMTHDSKNDPRSSARGQTLDNSYRAEMTNNLLISISYHFEVLHDESFSEKESKVMLTTFTFQAPTHEFCLNSD